MKWTKFSEHFPAESDDSMLVYDGKRIFMAYVGQQNKIIGAEKYCNNPKCSYSSDTCGCDIQLNDNSWWMPLPTEPGKE